MAALILKHTSTIGVREHIFRRYTLERKASVIHTGYGPIRIKTSEGYGVHKVKAEYEDIAKIAMDNDMSIEEVTHILRTESDL